MVPYLTVGVGVIRSAEQFLRPFTHTEAFLSGGVGVKAYLTPRVFLAPEFRIGAELHARVSAGVGYSWGR